MTMGLTFTKAQLSATYGEASQPKSMETNFIRVSLSPENKEALQAKVGRVLKKNKQLGFSRCFDQCRCE
jgi:hypothetical protein